VNPGELVMDQAYLDQMREFLTIIHDEFAILYDVVGAEGFGVDIEYKVTAQDQLIIKQARPWVSFWANVNADNDLGVTSIVSPQSSSSLGENELITATIANQGLNEMSTFGLELLVDDQLVDSFSTPQTIQPFEEANFQFSTPQDFSTTGDYSITVKVNHPYDQYENNDTLNVVLSKIQELDGAISVEGLEVVCADVVELTAMVTNYGETTINEVTIEVLVNDQVVDLITSSVEIATQNQDSVVISISENLQENNTIVLNLIEVNSQEDDSFINNSDSTTTSLNSDYDIITLTINADNYPQETSWKLLNEVNEIISTGSLDNNIEVYNEEICVNYRSCFTLYVYDSYGDGICCAHGEGNFQVFDSLGNTILINDGEFDNFTQEVFCLDESGCEITADISVLHASSTIENNGTITINTTSGLSPFQYSIDGGQTFTDSNTFNGLSPGTYIIIIEGAAGFCSYEESVLIDSCEFTTVSVDATPASSVVSTDGSIVINPTSGLSPYQFSIDGGQNFLNSNTFNNLPVGNYNIIVKDASEICIYEVEALVQVEGLIINEINYRSSSTFNADDWIELYNPKSAPIDVSNWQIKDDDDTHVFVIPEGTQIEGNGYLVFVKDASDFISVFPNIPYLGELGFGLGGSDAVRLFNSTGKLIDQVDYKVENPFPSCTHTLNMFDSYGDGWQGNAVDVIVSGQLVISQATFTDGFSASLTFDATQGDIIEFIWTDGDWSSEVSWEIIDGNGDLLASGEYGDTLVRLNVFARCDTQISDWPTCADGTGNTLELITPDLDNSLPESWNCINENGSPNAVNSGELSVQEISVALISVYPNPVTNTLYIKGNLAAFKIEVYSLLGQHMMTVSNVNKIDVSLFNEGVYLVKISAGNQTTIKRIIKF
jgi:hypothetical protein